MSVKFGISSERKHGISRSETDKRQRKSKGQSWIDNPENLAAAGAQDIRRKQTKQK